MLQTQMACAQARGDTTSCFLVGLMAIPPCSLCTALAEELRAVRFCLASAGLVSQERVEAQLHCLRSCKPRPAVVCLVRFRGDFLARCPSAPGFGRASLTFKKERL